MQQFQIKGIAIQECNSKEKNKAYKRQNKVAGTQKAHKRNIVYLSWWCIKII